MCLKKVKELNVAESDIVVWKHLREMYAIKQDIHLENLDGKPFEGVIQNIKTTGKISILKDKKDIYMYFCTDNSSLNGNDVFNKHGYPFSWILDTNVSLNETFIDGVCLKKYVHKEFQTPYQDSIVQPGNTYTSDLVKKVGYNIVNEGLHSYESKYDAIRDMSSSCGVVIKCIIPKGAKYYKGLFNTSDSYASDTLKYTNEYARRY